MIKFKQIISLGLAILAVFHTFTVVNQLIWFLSKPAEITINKYTSIWNLFDNKSTLKMVSVDIVYDIIYILCFILQHSIMKSKIYKSILKVLGLDVAERSIYTLATVFVLKFLIENWKKTTSVLLWQIDITNNEIYRYIYVMIHSFAWVVIYGGALIMDLPELIGIKQVFYNIRNYAAPMAYKSFQLNQFFRHLRHPSFIAFTLILWSTNLMSLDRLLLAIMLTLYMFIGWSTGSDDVAYHKCQLNEKFEEIRTCLSRH